MVFEHFALAILQLASLSLGTESIDVEGSSILLTLGHILSCGLILQTFNESKTFLFTSCSNAVAGKLCGIVNRAAA